MSAEDGGIQQTLDQHQSCLDGIRDAIFEAVVEGVKEGAFKGVKRGSIDGLKKECLFQGVVNVSESGIEDIVTYVLNSGINFDVITDICPSIEGAIGEYLDGVWHKVGGRGLEPLTSRM